jgi:hypothetical protein
MSNRSNFFEGFDDEDDNLSQFLNFINSQHIVEPTAGFMWRVVSPEPLFDEPEFYEVDELINENLLCEIDELLFECADKYGDLPA